MSGCGAMPSPPLAAGLTCGVCGVCAWVVLVVGFGPEIGRARPCVCFGCECFLMGWVAPGAWRWPTSRTSAALDTAAVGSMSLVIFDDPAALQRVLYTVTYRSPTLRALLSLLSHSELTVLEGSSGSDDGPVVSVVPEVI